MFVLHQSDLMLKLLVSKHVLDFEAKSYNFHPESRFFCFVVCRWIWWQSKGNRVAPTDHLRTGPSPPCGSQSSWPPWWRSWWSARWRCWRTRWSRWWTPWWTRRRRWGWRGGRSTMKKEAGLVSWGAASLIMELTTRTRWNYKTSACYRKNNNKLSKCCKIILIHRGTNTEAQTLCRAELFPLLPRPFSRFHLQLGRRGDFASLGFCLHEIFTLVYYRQERE